MNNYPASADDGFRPGEKVVRILPVTVRPGERRKDQAMMSFAVAVAFGVMLFGLVLIGGVKLHLLNVAQLAVICFVFWKFVDRFLKSSFPDFRELTVTNQRLILRAGANYTEWVSDGVNETEILPLAELSSFVVRPKAVNCSPREVYVKSGTAFHDGKELESLLRSRYSITGGATVLPSLLSSNLPSTSAPARYPATPSVPPGIAVTHAFLCNQLRSLMVAIPLPTLVAEIEMAATESPPALPPDTPPELGNTGYQFGVDR